MFVKEKIITFENLDVYQNSYQAMLSVNREIIPKLPKQEDCKRAR